MAKQNLHRLQGSNPGPKLQQSHKRKRILQIPYLRIRAWKFHAYSAQHDLRALAGWQSGKEIRNIIPALRYTGSNNIRKSNLHWLLLLHGEHGA